MAITVRKVCHQINHERRLMRGGGVVVPEVDLRHGDDPGEPFDAILAAEPTPHMAAEMAEGCRRLLDALADDDQRAIAVWKLEGYTNAEIATRLDCTRTTVQRKLLLIQARWERYVP